MESERSTPSQINELKALTMPRVWPISGGALFRHQIVVTLASLYPLSSWSGGRRSVDTLVSEQCPGDAGCLIGHGDQHDVCRPPRQELVAPAGTRARLGAAPAQHASRTMHEQAPDIAIPALRDPPQPVLAATRVLSGHQTEPGRELPARAKLRAISDRRDQRRRGDDTDAGDRRKPAARLVGSVPSQKRRLQLLDQNRLLLGAFRRRKAVGRVTASQIASASAASFLFVLTKGRTY